MASQKDKITRRVEEIIYRQVPSQIPVYVTVASYNRMLMHCTTNEGVWVCSKSGARIRSKLTLRSVYSYMTGQYMETVPVMHMYCTACDKEPQVISKSLIYDKALTTVAM